MSGQLYGAPSVCREEDDHSCAGHGEEGFEKADKTEKAVYCRLKTCHSASLCDAFAKHDFFLSGLPYLHVNSIEGNQCMAWPGYSSPVNQSNG